MGKCKRYHYRQSVKENWIYPKKKTFGYIERDEKKREYFLAEISKKDPETLIYIDESGIDDNEVYQYGWSLKGMRIYGMKSGVRKKRLSIIGALIQGKIRAPFIFEGMCNREIVEVYIEKVLIPELRPGQTVILDNASFHKRGKIVSLLNSAGCEALYLPPYSPDLNPIEHWWTSIKNKIRKFLSLCERDLYKAAEQAFSFAQP